MAPTNAELQRVAEEAIAAAEAVTAQAQSSAIARADAAAPVEAADRRVAELENTEQAQLHAHAITMNNIKLMIPLVLEQTSTFYNHWRSLFLNT